MGQRLTVCAAIIAVIVRVAHGNDRAAARRQTIAPAAFAAQRHHRKRDQAQDANRESESGNRHA